MLPCFYLSSLLEVFLARFSSGYAMGCGIGQGNENRVWEGKAGSCKFQADDDGGTMNERESPVGSSDTRTVEVPMQVSMSVLRFFLFQALCFRCVTLCSRASSFAVCELQTQCRNKPLK